MKRGSSTVPRATAIKPASFSRSSRRPDQTSSLRFGVSTARRSACFAMNDGVAIDGGSFTMSRAAQTSCATDAARSSTGFHTAGFGAFSPTRTSASTFDGFRSSL